MKSWVDSYHIDSYRLEYTEELGLEEIFSDPDNIVLAEWAEKAKELLPTNTTNSISFKIQANQRRISVR